MSAKGLVNANQQRRLGTGLRMLRHDVTALASLPEVTQPGEAANTIRALAARIVPAVEALEASLGLPPERPVPAGRRVAAMAEVWANRLADLHARNLRAYGKVHPELAAALDERLDTLVGLLEELAQAGTRLPSR